MSTQHTPGPWMVDDGCYNDGPLLFVRAVEGSQPSEDDDIAGIGPDTPENRANANLIAQSPALLFIAELLDADVRSGECCPICSQSPHDLRCIVVATLAKVKGQS